MPGCGAGLGLASPVVFGVIEADAGGRASFPAFVPAALRGLPLQLVAVPPPAIPRRRNTYYYQLDTRGSSSEAQKDWEAIAASRGLSIEIPRDIRSAQFELLGLEGA